MISILMPIRNAEPFLLECLQSILNQKYIDWELLAVNDHSTDGTLAILDQFAQQDSRIQYFNNQGKGIIHALRLAYTKSKGNFITRMDADDIMPKEKLLLMHQMICKNPKALITGKVHYIAEDKVFDGYKRYEQWLNNLVDTSSHYKEIYKECVIASPCWLIAREQFEHCGAFENNRYPEDYDLCFRFYEHKIPIKVCPEILHIWRDHSTRASRNDDNYADNSFLELKLHYFIKLDYTKTKTLVLWGAGKKAKKIAQLLQSNKIPFLWACNNENKIGHRIYNQILQDVNFCFDASKSYQAIIQVANEKEQQEIRESLLQQKNVEAFWFC